MQAVIESITLQESKKTLVDMYGMRYSVMQMVSTFIQYLFSEVLCCAVTSFISESKLALSR